MDSGQWGDSPQPPDQRAPHQPVMVDRVTSLLAVDGHSPVVLVDATVGAAGHAAALLAASGPRVHLVGFDRDEDALDLTRRRLAAYADRVTLVHAPFDALAEHVAPVVERVGPLLGVLYDLGVSSMQLDRPERGFSFRASGPLDMRMDRSATLTAEQLVNGLSALELTRIISRLGEERFARRIAAAIVRARPLHTTAALADVVSSAVPAATQRPGHHPATRTFQALRIAVNTELDRFSASLPQALELSLPTAGRSTSPSRGGRIVVLSYHSLEDRIAKRCFSDATAGCICPPDLPVCGCGRVQTARHLTRGAERPAADEVARNPRARPARLRAVERIAGGTPRGPVSTKPES
ncbi:MAG: 16S rRNA (cytosine(1402)-N(4))-methyltransferase RsmH [Egibacteraceae bacterium]